MNFSENILTSFSPSEHWGYWSSAILHMNAVVLNGIKNWNIIEQEINSGFYAIFNIKKCLTLIWKIKKKSNE